MLNRRTRTAQTSAKSNPVQIWSPESGLHSWPGWLSKFPKFTGDFLVHIHSTSPAIFS